MEDRGEANGPQSVPSVKCVLYIIGQNVYLVFSFLVSYIYITQQTMSVGVLSTVSLLLLFFIFS